MPPFVLLATAFVEGLCVLLIEIGGARAMAPYFGTTLTVWTAQITATLLFLALGYRLGGHLSRRVSPWHLPGLFGAAGIWLLLFRWTRTSVMATSAGHLGIAAGSFASAAALFGLPLLCLGAVSPLLIAAIDRSRPGAGSAAGSLFFVNTIGGLAGGWATAFLVVPYLSVPTALAATAGALLVLAAFWTGARRGMATAAVALVAALGAGAAVVLAATVLRSPPGLRMNRVLYERESSIGQLQVVDYGFAGHRGFLIDGVAQSEVNTQSGRTLGAYITQLDGLAHHFAPGAKRALVLGLGAGVLSKLLAQRGIAVTAVDADARIEEVARQFFDLPASVRVEISDGRTFLRRDREFYDLIFLDVYAGESGPWHMSTIEAFEEMAARLAPGGRILVNSMASAQGPSRGLESMEAALLRVLPELRVFVGGASDHTDQALVNALLVAGEGLDAGSSSAPPSDRLTALELDFILPRGRQGRTTAVPATDDWSDVDQADAGLRARCRRGNLELHPPVSADL